MKLKSYRWLLVGGLLVAFIGAYFITRDLIKATWVLVIASAIALAVGYAVERRFCRADEG